MPDVGRFSSEAVNVEFVSVARDGEGQWARVIVGVADEYLLQLRIQACVNGSEITPGSMNAIYDLGSVGGDLIALVAIKAISHKSHN